MKNTIKKIFFVVIAVIIFVVIVFLLKDYLLQKNAAESIVTASTEATEPKIIEKIVEVEKDISAETIQDGLADIGVLVTEEYYFTQVESYEKTKTILKFFKSSSNFIYSYDGVVTAGIDCSNISVEKDDDSKVIAIDLPASEIQYIDIDYDSFQVYEEKEGLWNPMSLEDYNDSMAEFEDIAREKAIDKGVLDRADENAKTIIENFVVGIIGDSDYTIEWKENLQ